MAKEKGPLFSLSYRLCEIIAVLIVKRCFYGNWTKNISDSQLIVFTLDFQYNVNGFPLKCKSFCT